MTGRAARWLVDELATHVRREGVRIRLERVNAVELGDGIGPLIIKGVEHCQ